MPNRRVLISALRIRGGWALRFSMRPGQDDTRDQTLLRQDQTHMSRLLADHGLTHQGGCHPFGMGYTGCPLVAPSILGVIGRCPLGAWCVPVPSGLAGASGNNERGGAP